MPLPVDYNTVNVTGRYTYLDGTPAVGSVRFTGKTVAISDATDTVILPSTVVATLVDGAFSIQLPATDDPDVVPNGWTYEVEERFTNGGGRKFEIDVPVAATRIDLSEVAPVSPATGDPTAFVTLSAFEEHVANASEGGGGGVSSWNDLLDKPTEFPPSAHQHSEADIPTLATTLATKASATHTHAQSDVTGLTTALAGKADQSSLTAHTGNTSNPHGVTKSQVGLGNVDNTSDLAKPVSTAVQNALNAKTDVLVLATGAAVPGGTRVGTVILRTA